MEEKIIQKPIIPIKNEPTKMTKKELAEYALVVEERAKLLQEQVDQYLKSVDDSNNSRNNNA